MSQGVILEMCDTDLQKLPGKFGCYLTGKSHHCPVAPSEPLTLGVRWLLPVCVRDEAGGASAGHEGLNEG